MATSDQNLSIFDLSSLGDCSKLKIGIVTADWNHKITSKLKSGALSTLKEAGLPKKNISQIDVPGSFELIAGARLLASREPVDAVLCIGCVIQGETPHFDVINSAVAHGIAELNVISGIPFVFGVLTTLNETQAKERAGGKHGNKGAEGAFTALKMGLLKKENAPSNSIGFKG